MLAMLSDNPEGRAAVEAVWSRALSGEEFVETDAFGDPALERRYYEMRFRTLRDPQGAPIGAYQLVYDVTDRLREQERLKNAEAALLQSRKMEAVGQLTGGIAHDFNNLLQGVAGSLDLIRRNPEDRMRVRRWAEAGLHAAERGAKLTGQLLAFSRAQKIEVKPLVASDLVRGMRDLLDRTLAPKIRVVLNLHDEGAAVLSDPTQLEMAILNLAINARDATPGDGTLTISTELRRLNASPELPDGEYVELSVADTGSGMSPEVVARAFDPFFTTKELGKGTGLGLSQVYGIARQGGGTAQIESYPGRGTTVRIFLKRTGEKASVLAKVGGKSDTPLVPNGSVVVIDDDADVRRFLIDSFESLGYRVEAAPDGKSGLEAIERIEPHLLVVDFAMPGMNGADVAQAVRRRRPDLPIIFASGYADSEAIEAVLGKDKIVLRKPFRIDELQMAVREALARNSAGVD
jgi:signal transduction histidine kinase/CheY-like chemotaxis protein